MIIKYSNCEEFYCEGRPIHPTNVNRISVCVTNKSETNTISDKIAPKSQKYDYLLEKADTIFSFKRFKKEKMCVNS
jgi:hypothetical protein